MAIPPIMYNAIISELILNDFDKQNYWGSRLQNICESIKFYGIGQDTFRPNLTVTSSQSGFGTAFVFCASPTIITQS